MARRVTLAAAVAATAAVWLCQPGPRAAGVQESAPLGPGEFVLSAPLAYVTDLALDGRGNIIVAGSTSSPDFPTTPDAADRTCRPDIDAFVQIYSRTGALRYSTCLGSEEWEGDFTRVAPAPDGSLWVVSGIAPGHMGGVWLWRIAPGVPGYRDVIRIGASHPDAGWAHVAASPDGSAWVAGSTYGRLAVVNALQPTTRGRTLFLGHFAPGRQTPLVLTYLGGGNDEIPVDLALAPDGDPVVLGYSWGHGFPLVRPFQATYGGYSDLVLARLDVSGRWIEYSTYLGGSDAEQEGRLVIDPAGYTFVVGRARSVDFPATAPAAVRDARRDIFSLAFDGFGAAMSAALIDTGIAPGVSSHLVQRSVEHAAPRPDGSLLILSRETDSFADPPFNGVWLNVVDPWGATVCRPRFVDFARWPGEEWPLWGAVASGPRDVYLVTHRQEGFVVAYVVRRVRLGATDVIGDGPGDGRERR